MGQFNGFKFTSRGLTLHSKVQTGDLLQFTRIAVGDGALGSTDPVALNGLISQKKSLQITKLESLGGGRSVVGTALTNGDVTTGFYLREIGVFAQDPDVGEILYCYGNAGTTADWIPPGAGGGQDLIEQAMNIETITGNAPNVSAVINQSLVFATAAQLGNLSQLLTTAKGSAVAAINELFTNASDGKSAVAAAVTGKGVAASASDTFATLASKIGNIAKDTTALASHLLYNKVMYADGVKVTGTATGQLKIYSMPVPSAVNIAPMVPDSNTAWFYGPDQRVNVPVGERLGAYLVTVYHGASGARIHTSNYRSGWTNYGDGVGVGTLGSGPAFTGMMGYFTTTDEGPGYAVIRPCVRLVFNTAANATNWYNSNPGLTVSFYYGAYMTAAVGTT